MRLSTSRFSLPHKLKLTVFVPLLLLCVPAFAGSVKITSPAANSSSPLSVRVTASASESGAFHLELWDNGQKLGNVQASSVNAAYTLPAGSHTLTVQAVSNGGSLLDLSRTSYTVSGASSNNGVNISSPVAGSTSISAVNIAASMKVSGATHMEIWDNGYKLGQVSANSVNGVYVLPSGSHTMTIQALGSSGSVLSKSSVSFKVANLCKNSSTVQCNMNQSPIDNTQSNCSPKPEPKWVVNFCGQGIQGSHGKDPERASVAAVNDGGTLPDQGNTSLDGHSAHLSETRGSNYSNVLFRVQTPSSASKNSVDSHWTMDEYVYLPNVAAHQAFEMDTQYTINGVWTKFYTECAFNQNRGTGYWAVFDTKTGGWIYLNGQKQNGQTPPFVACDRSYFTQPWAGSGNPSFNGWHHVVWHFIRNSDGTVTFASVTVDARTTQVNFHPNSGTGGYVSDNGNFSTLVQLDGADNPDGQYNTVDAYVDEISLTHTK